MASASCSLFSSTASSPFVRAIELIAVIVVGVLALSAVVALVTGWLAGWQQDEAEFELVVRRAERLADENLAVDPDELEFLELDPLHDGDFEELVRDALDELPDLLQNALDARRGRDLRRRPAQSTPTGSTRAAACTAATTATGS